MPITSGGYLPKCCFTRVSRYSANISLATTMVAPIKVIVSGHSSKNSHPNNKAQISPVYRNGAINEISPTRMTITENRYPPMIINDAPKIINAICASNGTHTSVMLPTPKNTAIANEVITDTNNDGVSFDRRRALISRNVTIATATSA